MVLIDTSVWIEFFRAKGNPALKSKVADFIIQNKAAYTCPVHYELILGARPNETKDLQTGLSLAIRINATSKNWDEASAIAAHLRMKGRNLPALDVLSSSTVAHLRLKCFSSQLHHQQWALTFALVSE